MWHGGGGKTGKEARTRRSAFGRSLGPRQLPGNANALFHDDDVVVADLAERDLE